MKRYQIFAGIMAMICMVLIFLFSAQPAGESSEMSGYVSTKIVTSANWLFHLNMDSPRIREVALVIEGIVRKIAHAIEYGILATCLFLWADCLQSKTVLQAIMIQLIGTLYAISDEVHQLYVPGRFGCAKDVVIDSVGVLVAILVIIGVRKCINSSSKKDKSVEIESL